LIFEFKMGAFIPDCRKVDPLRIHFVEKFNAENGGEVLEIELAKKELKELIDGDGFDELPEDPEVDNDPEKYPGKTVELMKGLDAIKSEVFRPHIFSFDSCAGGHCATLQCGLRNRFILNNSVFEYHF
jgi:hypothetical protein